jgi:HEAT repeat protein
MTNSDPTTKYVDFYLEKLRQGEFEIAFHSLIEAGRSIIPHLTNAFRNERSPSVRAELVNIIWNYRQPDTADFLAEALSDPDPKVWKSALDGLVTLASPSALQILETSSNRELLNKKQSDEFRKWVREAITQVQEAIAASGKNTTNLS